MFFFQMALSAALDIRDSSLTTEVAAGPRAKGAARHYCHFTLAAGSLESSSTRVERTGEGGSSSVGLEQV